MLVLTALALPDAEAAAEAPGERGKQGCRISSLPSLFDPAGAGKVRTRHASCNAGKGVAKGFARRCFGAYSGQGRCRVTAGGRWRCRSRLLGPLEGGAPARVKCRKRRGRVSFAVGWFPPVEPEFDPQAARSRGAARALSPAWNSGSGCIETSTPGNLVPPPSLANFQITVVGGVPLSEGESLQAALIGHNVWSVIRAGLASFPRINPGRLPILLTSGAMPGGTLGILAKTCLDDSNDAILVSAAQASKVRDPVAAHEVFHAFSVGRGIDAGAAWRTTWWEEASASWSVAKAGFPEWTLHENALQFPNEAIDTFNDTGYQYAMSSFVHFLEDHGFVTDGAAWPLQRTVIGKYPDATQALDQALDARNADLGEQVAAFWGDRILEQPSHGKPLKVGADGTRTLEIDPLLAEVPMTVDRLHTKMIDFKAADDVSRVELEFHAPPGGYFWARVEKNRSQRVRDGESLSFCLDGAGVDELEWPGSLPVTFTNGKLTTGALTGTIDVHAQTNSEQCQGGQAPKNRACRVLQDADIGSILGPGQYPFHDAFEDGEALFWVCFYVGSTGEVDLNLVHHRRLTAKQVRKGVGKQIEKLELSKVNVGDLAGVGTFVDDEGKRAAIMTIATGRENVLLIIGPGPDTQNAIRLGKRIVGQIE